MATCMPRRSARLMRLGLEYLLDAHQVGVDLLQHLGDPVEVHAAVEPRALVDVVAGDGKGHAPQHTGPGNRDQAEAAGPAHAAGASLAMNARALLVSTRGFLESTHRQPRPRHRGLRPRVRGAGRDGGRPRPRARRPLPARSGRPHEAPRSLRGPRAHRLRRPRPRRHHLRADHRGALPRLHVPGRRHQQPHHGGAHRARTTAPTSSGSVCCPASRAARPAAGSASPSRTPARTCRPSARWPGARATATCSPAPRCS